MVIPPRVLRRLRYVHERRSAPGGHVSARAETTDAIPVPKLASYDAFAPDARDKQT